MSTLVDAVRELFALKRRSGAVLAQYADGSFGINLPDHDLGGTVIITRAQLGELLWTQRMVVRNLADAEVARRVADAVADYHRDTHALNRRTCG